ncbi:AAA family ATPase [Fulvivirga sp. 29W222]|uniref:AAA family ATPase n=1 Tax=Fulvivirga marina TaxID=2494733 RepID=A0A937G2C8_9BACT|nr:AAA family ATPase [Fulvivirga marina]MBL6448763.1 AAA family ATPase [Fulvivirga marina]
MIVLITGLPGSGKSYLAEQLASRIDADYVNSDQVRKRLGAMGKYNLQDKLEVYRKMVSLAENSLRKGRAVVVDATFYLQSTRNIFIALARKYTSVIHMIVVYADEGLIKKRLSLPRKNSEADFAVYERVKAEFEAFTFPHLELESTDDNINTMLNRAVNYLESKWHE